MAYRIKIRPPFRIDVRKLGVTAAWVCLGGALFGIVFVLSFYMAMKVEMRSTEVTIPDLTAMEMTAASQVTETLGLELQVVDRRHDPAVASGRILQQEPFPGASVRRGRKIKVVLSEGGKQLVVPKLIGRADRTVEMKLKRDGFAPGDRARAYSGGTDRGRVLAQVPPSGTPAVPNTRVHRLVSNGPYPVSWVAPDLTGLSRTAAEHWIRSNGFRRGSMRKVPMAGRRSGIVVGQLPLPGYPLQEKGVVELTVAR